MALDVVSLLLGVGIGLLAIVCVRAIDAIYEAPRTWIGLTDADRLELAAAQHGWEDLLIAAETKLKEKNA
jgi:hypothetical protein